MTDTNQLPPLPTLQTAQAAQADVTLPHLWPVISWLKNGCDVSDAITELEFYERHIEQARAILALRPVQVPMTDEQHPLMVFAIEAEMGAYQENEIPLAARKAIKAAKTYGITAQADLWCIHIPGPDEVHASPSKEAAEHMAAKHNAAMATYYASGALNLEFAPPLENVQAVVIKWPHDQQSHADELREFDYASWGITAQAKKEDA